MTVRIWFDPRTDEAPDLDTQSGMTNKGLIQWSATDSVFAEVGGMHVRKQLHFQNTGAQFVVMTIFYHAEPGGIEIDNRGKISESTKMIADVPAGVPYHKMDDTRGPIRMG